MTDREKLIDLIVSADISLFGTGKPYAEVYADYLLANGVIVPPCKVGDIVYFVQDKKIYKGIVILIRPFIHKSYTTFHGNVEYELEDPFYHDGRTMRHNISVVFQKYEKNTVAYFTKEEAEKALENLKNTK